MNVSFLYEIILLFLMSLKKMSFVKNANYILL